MGARTMTDEFVEQALPRERGAAAIARRLLERQLSDLNGQPALDEIKLVATELIDNAYRHGQGEIRLRLQRRGDRVRVEVIDEGRGAAIKIREDGPELGGWGLKLVDGIASGWGAFEGTTHVWAEISVPERDSPGGSARLVGSSSDAT